MEIDWSLYSRDEWDALAAGAALQQHWAYGAAMRSQGAGVRRAVARDGGEPIAIAQFTVRSVGGLADWALCTRGPHWLAPIDEAAKAEVYAALRRTAPLRRPRAVFFTPDEREGADGALRRAGLRRVMTGYSTAVIDLTRDPDSLLGAMHGKWRNRLRAAERSGLRVQPNGLRPPQYRWLLAREESQRKARGYTALPAAMTLAWQAACGARRSLRIFRADLAKSPAAAMLFLVHGKGATYHIGWCGEDGRRQGAHNLALWEAMRRLKEEGVETLDMGGVNTESAAGVARFKLGAGAAPLTLCGAYF